MPWQRVEEIAEYRLNTKKLDAWLKKKWGDHDYQIKARDSETLDCLKGLNVALYGFDMLA
ncbi:MAG: hypothetical protein Q9215_003635 [Flavoplaca cf. flavocitrina]